jgi:hypothetical protein
MRSNGSPMSQQVGGGERRGAGRTEALLRGGDGAARASPTLAGVVEIKLEPGGDGLLDGEFEAEIHLGDGTVRRVRQKFPPGSPARPPTEDQLRAKLADCVGDLETDPSEWTWENVPGVLRRFLPGGIAG